MKKWVAIAGGIAVLGLAVWWLRSESQPENSQENRPPSSQPTPVSVQTVKNREVELYEELPGRVVAFEVAEVRPQVTGIVTKRLFEEGSRVEQGDQLYQIDPAPYEAAHQRAQADLAKAKANVKSIHAKAGRYEELVQIDAISRQDYDDITAGLEQAKADVAIAEAALVSAQIDLDYTQVRAPISGQISKSLFTKGALVTANQPQYLAKITQLDPIYADVAQPRSQLSRLRQSLGRDQALDVELYIEGQAERYKRLGKLQFADVTVDRNTGSVQLRALFPNPDGVLLPGMFVRARMKVETRQGILAPQRAATRGPDGGLSFWVVKADNTVEKRTVQSERAVDDAWLVTEGLRDGETIVTEGIQKVQPGSPVDPSPESEDASDSAEDESTSDKEQN